MADELIGIDADLAHLARLAIAERPDDVRLFVARLVRKYRSANPQLATQMDQYLRANTARGHNPLRKADIHQAQPNQQLPLDDESRLSLLKAFNFETKVEQPILSKEIEESLNQLIQERRQSTRLLSRGLQPTSSAIFVGPPGVGKTMTARWLAEQLNLPLYILDLTAVMSSFLGRSGSNLRAALDFSKKRKCVLLLDEIDAIAKRRNDDTDVGELKRLVTVILQEVDEWPSDGLLLAATNHPELIDIALWRRFDLIINFGAPDNSATREAIKRFSGQDYPIFERWIDILAFVFAGDSYSNIEREVSRIRRSFAIGISSDTDLIENIIKIRSISLPKQEKIKFAVVLASQTRLSQHTISNITGVSRDTIRKYKSEQTVTTQ
jgi:SpoVK/Ycf46/Vps4 family AAA+-type ATPase